MKNSELEVQVKMSLCTSRKYKKRGEAELHVFFEALLSFPIKETDLP